MTATLRQRLVLVAAGVAIGLGGVEIGLRLAARTATALAWTLREWDPAARLIELRGDHCYRGRPGTTLHYPNGAVARVNRMGFRGPESAVPTPPGTYRVVLVGGSTVHGFGVGDEETIDAHLRAALAATGTGARVEVVNLGFDGLDVLCDLDRLEREGLALEPDAVVAHTGINDVAALRRAPLGPDDPIRGFRVERRRAEEARARQPRWWTGLKHYVYLARLPGVVRHLSAARAVPFAGPETPDPAALDVFAATLRRLIAVAPPSATIALSVPPSAPDAAARGITARIAVVDAPTTLRYRAAIAERMAAVAATSAASDRRVVAVTHDVPAELFVDDCHLVSEGNRLVAAGLARVLAPAVLSRFPAPGRRDAR
jgi:lysophospholipase L1-like esterase